MVSSVVTTSDQGRSLAMTRATRRRGSSPTARSKGYSASACPARAAYSG